MIFPQISMFHSHAVPAWKSMDWWAFYSKTMQNPKIFMGKSMVSGAKIFPSNQSIELRFPHGVGVPVNLSKVHWNIWKIGFKKKRASIFPKKNQWGQFSWDFPWTKPARIFPNQGLVSWENPGQSHPPIPEVVLSLAPRAPTLGNRPSVVTPAGNVVLKSGEGWVKDVKRWENAWCCLMLADFKLFDAIVLAILCYLKQQWMRIIAGKHGGLVCGLNHMFVQSMSLQWSCLSCWPVDQLTIIYVAFADFCRMLPLFLLVYYQKHDVQQISHRIHVCHIWFAMATINKNPRC